MLDSSSQLAKLSSQKLLTLGPITARPRFDMTYSNMILKYSLRVIFNYRGKTQMAKSDEINHVGYSCQVVWLIDGQRPSLVTLEIIVSI